MNGSTGHFPRVTLGQCVTVLMMAGWLSVSAVPAAQQEKNPPGDIPDSQVFIDYSSPLGIMLKVPEGWARTERDDGVRFADKYNTIDLSVAPAVAAPSEASVKAVEMPALVNAGHNVEPGKVDRVTFKGGVAIRIRYKSDSDVNPVTHRQLREEHERLLFYHEGRQATLDLSAPVGADNVDQWRLMANSFRWK